MLTGGGGASVLSWLATRRRIDGTNRKDGAWLNALEARMRVHAVRMRRYDKNDEMMRKTLIMFAKKIKMFFGGVLYGIFIYK